MSGHRLELRPANIFNNQMRPSYRPTPLHLAHSASNRVHFAAQKKHTQRNLCQPSRGIHPIRWTKDFLSLLPPPPTFSITCKKSILRERVCWRHGRCSSPDVTLRAEARAPCSSARGCRGVGGKEHTVRAATRLPKNTETCRDTPRHTWRFSAGTSLRALTATLEISVLLEKPNKQIDQIMEVQGHLARQDLWWIWVLVANGVDPVIGSDTTTK